MKDIKTKHLNKKDIKKFNRNSSWKEKIKSPLLLSKEFNNDSKQNENNVLDYGNRKINSISKSTVRGTTNISKRVLNKGKNKLIEKVKSKNKKRVKTNTEKIKKTSKRVKKIPKNIQNTKLAFERGKQLAIKTTQTTVKGIKIIGKTVVTGIKALIEALSSLIGLLGVGGVIALIVIVLICLIGLLCNSVFGIFMVNENTSNSISLNTISTDLNLEMDKKIEEIKKANSGNFTEVKINDNRASWKNVVIIYAVKISSGNNTSEVITIDDSRKEELKKIFFDMNKLDSSLDNGILTININGLSIESMVTLYSFTEQQKKLVKELSDSKYDSYFEGFSYDSPIFTNDYWLWPNSCSNISSPYGMRWGSLHDGLDIACPINSNIYAAADGKVVVNSTKWDNGNYLYIDHGNGFYTVYAHLNKTLVKVGDTVKKGQVIAKEGSTGYSTGPHLHFSIWKGYPYSKTSSSINPSNYFK